MSVQKYALVNAEGLVVNVVLWDGTDNWSPSPGLTAIQSDVAVIGGHFIDGIYIPPESSEAS